MGARTSSSCGTGTAKERELNSLIIRCTLLDTSLNAPPNLETIMAQDLIRRRCHGASPPFVLLIRHANKCRCAQS